MSSCTSSNYPSARSCNDGCISSCLKNCSNMHYGSASNCSNWCLVNCVGGCLATCGYGCGTSGCTGVCTNACRCSCGNGCGANCVANCIATNGHPIGCDNYCLHSTCGFDCGGDAEIKTNIGCGSSSCSATRFRTKLLYKTRFLYNLCIYIIYMI